MDLPDATERTAIWTIHLGFRKQDHARLDSEIEQTLVAALYRALHRKQPLTTDLLLEELTQTIPLSVTRSEEINRLLAMAQSRFVNVR